jgi:foldase protein PrsA
MRTQRFIFGWVAALSLLTIIGCGKKSVDSVATVNGEPISRDEYYGHLERKQVIQVQTAQGPQDAQVVGSLGLQALHDMVNRKLLMQMATKEGLMPTAADVDRELDFQRKRRPDFVSFLTDRGMTLQQIREDLKFDLARERLLTKGINVTKEDVDTYVKENPKEFMEPAQAQVLYIVVSDPTKKDQVDKDLSNGQSFQVVATRYSEAPQAREMAGMYPVSRLDLMPQPLQKLVSVTPEMKTSDWKQDGKNWVKFYIQKKTPSRPIALDDVKKEYVRRMLAMRQGERQADLAKKLNDMLKIGNIAVASPYLKGPWEKALERAKGKTAQTENGSRASS